MFRLCLFDVSYLNVEYLQKCLVMMTAFGCCRADGRGASQSHNHLRSCKVWGKIGEGSMEDDRGMVMEVEGAWNLGKMNMLSCMRAGIAI